MVSDEPSEQPSSAIASNDQIERHPVDHVTFGIGNEDSALDHADASFEVGGAMISKEPSTQPSTEGPTSSAVMDSSGAGPEDGHERPSQVTAITPPEVGHERSSISWALEVKDQAHGQAFSEVEPGVRNEGPNDGPAARPLQPRELARRRMQLAGMSRRSDSSNASIRMSQKSEEEETESEHSSSRQRVQRSLSKKTTLGGFTIVRDDSDTDSSDVSSLQRTQSMDEERAAQDRIEALVDNEMSKVMANRQSTLRESVPGWSMKPKLERAFSEDCDLDGAPMGLASSTATTGRRTSKEHERKEKALEEALRKKRTSVGSIHEDNIRSLFAPGAGKYMKTYHKDLGRVVKHVFALDDVSVAIKSVESDGEKRGSAQQRGSSLLKVAAMARDWKSSRPAFNKVWQETRRLCHRIVCNSFFLGFFLTLTVYALFGPDLVALLGSKETDNVFVVLNTITFFLFIIELLLLVSGHKSYICTVPCALDIVAILSFIGDTALMGKDDGLAGTQLADQTRMTRLTRISRVARVTRLVPRILALFRRNKVDLAKRLLLRRLYRAFQFLDNDQDGFIASFDLKMFYLTAMQDCPQMFKTNRTELLRLDSEILMRLSDNLEDEQQATINYQNFCKTILSTCMGQSMVAFHLEDIEHSKGVWTLTSKLSDSTALKVCIGILMLIILMNLLDVQAEDISVKQQLVHLHVMARNAHAQSIVNTTYLCEWIDFYRKEPKLLYLLLDSRTYVDTSTGSDACLPGSTALRELDPIKAAEAVIEHSGLRNSELVQFCWPNVEVCENGITESIAILDDQKEVKVQLLWSIVGMAVVIIIILIFIALFNRGMSQLSETTLHPLRSLVDDMMAVSSLELVNIDADVPVELVNGRWKPARKTNVKDVEELQHLQKAFKSMRGAIRSWSRYVPPSVVQRLFSAGIEATIGVSRVSATILFIDVYDFEDACRGLSPSEVNNTLGSVLGRIALVIQANRGTLLEFIGDEVLAVFNTPSVVRNHIYSAVASALEIHAKIAELPPILSEGRQWPIRCKCGVHTAVILAGNIGSHRRMKYGLLGDGVNLSARLKGINSRYRTQTLCSEGVKSDEYSSKRAVFRPLDRVAVKGKTEPTSVYEILGFAKGEDADKARILKEASAKHYEAFRYYYQRDFRRAKALFDDVALSLEGLNHSTVMVCGRDEPARQLKRRCIGYIREPPDPQWDGVERLTKKVFEMEEDDEDDSSMEELTVTSEAEAIKSRSTVDLTVGDSVGEEDEASDELPRSRRSDGVDLNHEMEDSSSGDVDRLSFCPCSSFNHRSGRICGEEGCTNACVRSV